MNFLFLFSISLFLLQNIHSQCLNNFNAYKTGEHLQYTVTYNWQFVWVEAGTVDFMIKKAQYKNDDVIHFDAVGNSSKNWDWMYKVRDRYQSYINPNNYNIIWAERNTNEGGYRAYESYFFDYKRKSINAYTETSKRPLKNNPISFDSCYYDVLTAAYYLRSLDISNIKINDIIPVKVILDHEKIPLYIRYLGKENITTRKKKTYRCHKFSCLLVEGTMFKGGEDLYVWVTDDENKIPVLIKAEILVGSIKVFINDIKNNKNPNHAEQ